MSIKMSRENGVYVFSFIDKIFGSWSLLIVQDLKRGSIWQMCHSTNFAKFASGNTNITGISSDIHPYQFLRDTCGPLVFLHMPILSVLVLFLKLIAKSFQWHQSVVCDYSGAPYSGRIIDFYTRPVLAHLYLSTQLNVPRIP